MREYWRGRGGRPVDRSGIPGRMPGILRARRGARRATLALPAPIKPAGAWAREFGRQPCPPREGRAMAPVSGTSRSRCCFRPHRPERCSEPSDPDRVCEVVPRVTHHGMSLIARPGAGARIGVIRSRAAASTRSCSSRSGAAARRYGRWARPNRYARDARYARHAWTGRWTAARSRGCGEAPAKTSGALCGPGGCTRPASPVRPPRAAPDDLGPRRHDGHLGPAGTLRANPRSRAEFFALADVPN